MIIEKVRKLPQKNEEKIGEIKNEDHPAIIVVIIPIIVVIWWLYDGIITYYTYIYITLYDGGAITILKNDGLRQWAWVLHQPDGILGSRHREDLIVKSEKTHREKWGKLGEMMKISPGKIMVSRESDGTKLGISQKVFFGVWKNQGSTQKRQFCLRTLMIDQ